MKTSEIVLLSALVATNAAWAAYAFTRGGGAAPAPDTADGSAAREAPRPSDPRARAEVGARAPELAAPPTARRPADTGAAATAEAATPPSRPVAAPLPAAAASPPSRAPVAVPPATGAIAASANDVAKRLQGWKEDVLQIEDARRREEGLDAIEVALRSTDATTAAGALRSLYDLRDVPYDKQRFRNAVLSRLDDPDARVREAATFALMQVKHEDGDVDRLLDAVEARLAEGSRGLVVAAWLSKNRVEGRLADLFVRALGVEDARAVANTANLLRGMWVTAEVEDAVLAAWRRTKDDRGEGDGWNYILGQISPTREPRVRAIFELLRVDHTDTPQLLNRALEAQNLDPAAKPLAVTLALEGLPKAPNSMIRAVLIKVVRDNGTLTDVPALRAFAANSMVGEDVRRAATEAADTIERRR